MSSNPNNPKVKPTVWVVHDKGGYTFDNAVNIGDIKVIFKGDFNPFDLHAARRTAEEALKTSSPNDWIIGVGSGLAGMLVAITFVQLHDKLPVLVYHTQRREYVKRELDSFHQIHG